LSFTADDAERFVSNELSTIRLQLKELDSLYHPNKVKRLSETQAYLFHSLASTFTGKTFDSETGEEIRMKLRRTIPESMMTELEILGEKINYLSTPPQELLSKEEAEKREEELNLAANQELVKQVRKVLESRRGRLISNQEIHEMFLKESNLQFNEARLAFLSSRLLESKELEDLIFKTLSDVEAWLESKGYKQSADPDIRFKQALLDVLRQSDDLISYFSAMERLRMQKERTDFEGQPLSKRKFKGLFEARISREEFHEQLSRIQTGTAIEPETLGNRPIDIIMQRLMGHIFDNESTLPKDIFVQRVRGWEMEERRGRSIKIDCLVAFVALDERDATEKMASLKERILNRLSQERIAVQEVNFRIKEISKQELERGRQDPHYENIY
jgi:hypothetical protein